MSTIKLRFPTDDKGLVGRECPNNDCTGLFKIKFGTGLEGTDLLCTCPYCGHKASQDEFWTHDQLKLMRSEIKRQVVDPAINQMSQRLERSFRHHRGVTYKANRIGTSLFRYSETDLETDVTCDSCTLRYAIYGVFAFCPDCGRHNSQQILNKNLDVVERMLAMANDADADVAEKIKEDALENVVSAFDGFGREVCRVNANAASEPAEAKEISFQNVAGAERGLRRLFGFDLASCLQADAWQFVKRSFQKRHPFAHKMGVVDDKYVAKADDPHAVVGRKVVVTVDEILKLAGLVRLLGQSLHSHFSGGGGE